MAQVVDHVAMHARLQPGRLAAVDLPSLRRWRYAALDDAVARCAGLLRDGLGLAEGERIASLARNGVDLLILHLACARTGCIYVPLNWRLAAAELADLIADAAPSCIVADADFLPALPDKSAVETQAFAARLAAAAPAPPVPIAPDRASLILYTSGTSGRPKGALLTEANIEATASNFALLGRVTQDSVFLCDAPMFHIIGLVTCLRPALRHGGTVLVSGGFDPPRTLARLADPALAVTHYFCVPQMAARLRAEPTFDAAALAGRVTMFTGGAPHPADSIRRWLGDGIAIVDGYGMSEAGTVFGMSLDPAIIAAKAGSVGVPTCATQVRIVGTDSAPCADGTPGEVQLRGANVIAEYWRRPEATAGAFTADGWFQTGDIAVRDGDGFYRIVDRKKDMFISGGENVYPAEIEAALSGLPGLAEAAVVGVPDEHWGEVGHAALVAQAGAVLEPDAVRGFLLARLARYKVPKHISIVAALPRTGSGKVRKQQLRGLLQFSQMS